jgi:hypothetical protein
MNKYLLFTFLPKFSFSIKAQELYVKMTNEALEKLDIKFLVQ